MNQKPKAKVLGTFSGTDASGKDFVKFIYEGEDGMPGVMKTIYTGGVTKSKSTKGSGDGSGSGNITVHKREVMGEAEEYKSNNESISDINAFIRESGYSPSDSDFGMKGYKPKPVKAPPPDKGWWQSTKDWVKGLKFW